MASQLPDIWRTVLPLKKNWARRAAMEAAFQRTADNLRFRPPRTPHAVAFMVMALTFHTKEPYGVGDALNILFLPNLYHSAGLEAALLTCKYDAILGGGTITSFENTSLLMVNKRVAPITCWDKASSQLKAWAVSCTVLLGQDGVHPATYKMFLLL